MKHLRRKQPSLESRVVTPGRVFVVALAGAGLFISSDTYTQWKHNLNVHFDDTISSELIAAKRNPSLRASYVDGVVRRLRAQGQLTHLHRVVYDPHGHEFRKFVKEVDKEIPLDAISYPGDQLAMITTSKYRAQARNTLQDTICFITGGTFGDHQSDNFADVDIEGALADHEDLHGKIDINGLSTGFISSKQYLLLSSQAAPLMHVVEELLAYHKQVEQVVTGKRLVSRPFYKDLTSNYAMMKSEALKGRTYLTGLPQQLVDFALLVTSDIEPLQNYPWVSYKKQSQGI